jgi:hypothetical protein
VPISLTVGPPAARLNGEASTINGFDLVATVFLSSIDDIVRKLWEGLTYPQDITPADAAKLLDVGVLDDHFTGVPDGAQLGPLLLPAPPTMHTVAGNTVAVTQPLRVQLVDPAGTTVELVAVATVQFPVVLLTTENEVGINWFGIPASTTVSLTVDLSSGLQPRDAASLQRFSARIALGVGNAVAGLAKTLNLSPVVDVPGHFDRSKLRVDSAALWLSRWNQTDQLTFALLPPEVREEDVAEPSERVEQRDAGRVVRSFPVLRGRGLAGLDRCGNAGVVGRHRVQQCRDPGVPLAHQRPQPGVLARVVRVQEAHHPSDVLTEGDALRSLGVGRGRQRGDGAAEVAPQRVVDDAHHPRVGRCIRDLGHGRSFSSGRRRRTTVSTSHSS